MYLPPKFGVFLVIAASCCAFAQEGSLAPSWKSEGGLIISWEPISSSASAKQVEIFDEQRRLHTRLNVLTPVDDARRVSVYDVSARGNLIAVAAVYESKEGNRKVRPTAALLLFDRSGRFLSVFALDPSRQIALLAVDDDSNIWTLTDHADTGIDPATVPMIVKYTAQGKVAKELLTRDMFPFHASDTQQSIEIGGPAMGYEAGVVWFWLPGSTDFVTISTGDNKIRMVKTLLPTKASGNVVPLSVRREPSGDLVAQVSEVNEQGELELGHYKWSEGGTWKPFKPGKCEGGGFIGISDKGQIYRPQQGEATNVCVFREHN